MGGIYSIYIFSFFSPPFAGSVFLADQNQAPIHAAFDQSVINVNANPTILNKTRLDKDTQYAKSDQFDAYQKVCTEMDYRYVENVLVRIHVMYSQSANT